MRETRLMMGMPITIDIVGATEPTALLAAFDSFDAVDRRFSTYRTDSEITAINRGDLDEAHYSDDMREILSLAAETKCETDGFFDICQPDGSLDPSGIVKGWAIRNAARLIARTGARDFFVDAGGD